MSDFFKRVYQCRDGHTFEDFADAWNYECNTYYPNIKMFDKEGSITNDIRIATDFITNTRIEVEFIEDYLLNIRNGIIFNMEAIAPHSWIMSEPYDCDYILYSPQQYHNKNIQYYDEIYAHVQKDSDLWNELQGQ